MGEDEISRPGRGHPHHQETLIEPRAAISSGTMSGGEEVAQTGRELQPFGEGPLHEIHREPASVLSLVLVAEDPRRSRVPRLLAALTRSESDVAWSDR